jgi:hypothetical protein
MARQPQRDNHRYQDFLLRYGVVDVVEILAHRAGQPQAAIALLRTAEQGAFTPACCKWPSRTYNPMKTR